MNQTEYNESVAKLDEYYNAKIRDLRQKYIIDNAKFKVGDFVGNVTGIIKVEKIHSDLFRGDINIIYSGYRYKKIKGSLYRTKDNKISNLNEDNLKLITNN